MPPWLQQTHTDTDADRHADKQLSTGYTISSANWYRPKMNSSAVETQRPCSQEQSTSLVSTSAYTSTTWARDRAGSGMVSDSIMPYWNFLGRLDYTIPPTFFRNTILACHRANTDRNAYDYLKTYATALSETAWLSTQYAPVILCFARLCCEEAHSAPTNSVDKSGQGPSGLKGTQREGRKNQEGKGNEGKRKEDRGKDEEWERDKVPYRKFFFPLPALARDDDTHLPSAYCVDVIVF